MGQNKRKAPRSAKKPAAKRRAIESPIKTDTSGIASSKQSLSQLNIDDEQFERYLNSKPITKSVFSPELIEDEISSISEASVDDLDEIVEEHGKDSNDQNSTLADNDDDVAQHAKELEELKTTDPAFYQFLVDNDSALLGFGKGEKSYEDDDEEEETDGEKKSEASGVQRGSGRGSLLTLERFDLIRKSAEENKTLRGLTLLLAAYRGVVRSVAKMEDDVTIDEDKPDAKNEKKKFKEQKLIDEGYEKEGKEQQKKKGGRTVKLFFHVNIEGNEEESGEAFSVFNTVVTTVLQQIGKLLPLHVPVDGKDQKDNNGHVDMGKIAYPKAQDFKKRIQILVNQFWVDTAVLLRYFYGKLETPETTQELKQTVLFNLASPSLLRWLVCLPSHLRPQLTTPLTTLWLEARKCQPNNMNGPIAAFLVLQRIASLMGQPKFHTAAAKLTHKEKSKNKLTPSQMNDILQEAQQILMSECYRAFIHLVSKVGYSWRVASGYQFILNCLVELLSSIHSSTAYRVTFLAVRQLSLVARNASVARSQQRIGIKGASANSAAKVRSKRLEASEKQLFNWSFIFSARFLVQAIGKVGRQLKHLAFPLSSILTAVVKPELNASNRVPFVLHCLQLQCDLMNFLECWIPLGSHLLALGTAIVAHQERVSRPLPSTLKSDPRTKNQKKRMSNATHLGNKNLRQQPSAKHPSGAAAKSNVQKPPDLDVVIRLSDVQLEMPQVAEQLTARWLDLVINHLGLLSRHPSFPEAAIPLMFPLKKLAKSRNEIVRKELKQLLNHCETSITEVKQKRFNLDPTKDVQEGKLLIFNEKDIILAKYRSDRLAQRLELFTLKMNAEANAEHVIDDDESSHDEEMVDVNDDVASVDDQVEDSDHDDDNEMATESNGDLDSNVEDKVEAFKLDTDSEDDDDDEDDDDEDDEN